MRNLLLNLLLVEFVVFAGICIFLIMKEGVDNA